MTSLDYEDARPPIVAAAHGLYEQLTIHRAFGTIPIEASLRVYVVNDDSLLIGIGDLDDQTLFGEHADRAAERFIPLECFTATGLRLRRDIERIADLELPYDPDGKPEFGFVVWLQSEHWTQQVAAHAHGVTILHRGELA